MNNEQKRYLRETWSQMRGLRESLDRLSGALETLRAEPPAIEAGPKKRLMTTDEAAAYLGVSRRTLHNLMRDRVVPVVRLRGRLVRIDARKLDAWIEKYATKTMWDDWEKRGIW